MGKNSIFLTVASSEGVGGRGMRRNISGENLKFNSCKISFEYLKCKFINRSLKVAVDSPPPSQKTTLIANEDPVCKIYAKSKRIGVLRLVKSPSTLKDPIGRNLSSSMFR